MKVLVTGGAGYIGSTVTRALVCAGASPVVLDSLRGGNRAAVPVGVPLVVGDLANRALLRQTFDSHKFDGIMHFASNTLPGESMQEPFLYLGENVTNALNLLQEAVDHDVRRFVLSSTANLFDRPERMPIAEDEVIVPGSPYGESKYAIERMLYWLERTRGFHYTALRYFNASGAEPDGSHGESHDPEYHLIPIILQVALGQRTHVEVFGDDYPTVDGTCVRDYIHVSDLAQAHILALEMVAQSKSGVFNLGNGSGYSVMQVIETAREVTGHPIPAVIGSRRPGDPATLVASSERIRRELGWTPQYPELRTIIETAWRWHSAHPRGYESRGKQPSATVARPKAIGQKLMADGQCQ